MAKDLTEGSPARLIFFFTLPLLAGNIFQQLYAFVDTLVVGRFLGVEALAAVGCTGCLLFLMIGFVMGSTTGLAIVTGQRFGARDEVGVRRSAAACYKLAILMSIVLSIGGACTARPILELLQTPPEILDDAVSFITIVYGGIFLFVMLAVQSNMIRALGDSRTPTYLLAFGLTLNIIFEPLFIVVFKLGIPGAALATLTAQLCGNIAARIFISRRVPLLCPKGDEWQVSKEELLQHLKLGLPMGFQSIVIALGALVLQVALNGLGPVAVAAYAAAQKVDVIAVMPMMSFGMAMAAYTAQNYGARKLDRIREGVRKCLLMSGAFSIAVGVFNAVCGPMIMELFVGGEAPQVVAYGQTYLLIQGSCYFVLSVLFVLRFTLQGLGHTAVPTFAGVMELVMRSLAALVLVKYYGYLGASWASPLAWIGSCLPLVVAYFYERRALHDPV